MIRYLGIEQFGVWSTMLSVMSWIVFFDIGIGNGLTNKIAESLAKNNPSEAARYISSAYSLVGLISFSLFFIVTIATFHLPWQSIFNTTIVSDKILRYSVLISAFFIFLNFWLSLINQALNAFQRTATVVFGQFATNALIFAFINLLFIFTASSLTYLAFAYGSSLIITSCALTFWFYREKRDLIPRAEFDKQHIKPLLSLGLQFFVIQIAVLVIFTTDKILITQLFGPEFVAQYDVTFKLFSMIIIIHGLIITPLWSSYTDAYQRGDIIWIKGILHKQLIIFLVVIVAIIILYFLANPIIRIWIGEDLVVSKKIIFSMSLFVLISTWSNIFSYMLNGIGELKVTVISCTIAMFVNIPLSLYFVKILGFGMEGIILANCVALSLFAVLGPRKVFAILK